jgi:pimeloyl-ACP methyl ester carboxylesterase
LEKVYYGPANAPLAGWQYGFDAAGRREHVGCCSRCGSAKRADCTERDPEPSGLAPHVFVEPISIESIERIRIAYAGTGLRERLARVHDDADSAFFGWSDAWLSPAFRDWDITSLLPAIRCPLLAVQGRDDEYGTMAQIETLARTVPGAELLALDRCGHSPHRERPDALTAAVVDFVRRRSAVA